MRQLEKTLITTMFISLASFAWDTLALMTGGFVLGSDVAISNFFFLVGVISLPIWIISSFALYVMERTSRSACYLISSLAISVMYFLIFFI